MHIPDGFIDTPVAVAADVVAVGAMGFAFYKASKTMDDRQVPMAGLVAAFVFAVQMLNFPVAAGTSGHLLGGALAAILVGPWLGMIAIALVIIVQAVFFADGGISALGLNVLNMAVVTSLVGIGVFRVTRAPLPNNRTGVVVASFVGGLVAVVASATAFVVEYALGGAGNAPLGTVFAAMGGVHILIGIGEGIITAFAVGAVLAVRPDLVYGAQDLLPTLELTDVQPATGRGAA
jgi:cobalt/nickel transport system permease protein